MTSRRRQAAERRRQKNQKAGPPPPEAPAFLLVGMLRRPHGVKGEVLVSVTTDFPERLTVGTTLYMGAKHQPITIANIRKHNKGLIIEFNEFSRREDFDQLRNQELMVRADDRPPLPDGEYYLHQLIGLQAVTDEGQGLGVVAEWIETGANGVFVVRPESGGEILIPDIPDVVVGIDLDAGRMLIHLIPGLLPD
jgi:16S rRNA processing protein RimM